MHEDSPVLHATRRERTGSRYSKRLREQGRLPAIVYGHKQDPVAISLDAKEAIRLIHKGEKIYRIEVEGGKAETVLLRDLQFDYLGTNIVHCDLSRVDLTDRIRTRVPIRLIGDAVGLKKGGTTLMHAVTDLEIECLVTNLPDYIEVDISSLDLGDSIHAGDVKLPVDTMILLTDPHAEVAHIVGHTGELETDEAGDAAGQASPEVITEKKKEEE